MPALPDVPSVVRINLDFALSETLRGGVRQFWSFSGGPPSIANLEQLATDVSTTYDSEFAPLTPANYALKEVVCTDLTSDTSAQGLWSGTVQGTRSGANLPEDVAVLQSFTIARRYRGGKPRTYWPFGTITDLSADGTVWDTELITAVTDAWNTFKADLLALTGIGITITDHVNVSYYSGFASVQNPVTKRWRNIPTPRTGDAVVDGITGFVVDSFPGSQRRRRFSTAF
jgi:hypothetical protein